MPSPPKSRTTRDKVHTHRARSVAQGLRPTKIPDTRSPAFAAAAHRESLAIANSPQEAEDQAFIDAISAPFDE